MKTLNHMSVFNIFTIGIFMILGGLFAPITAPAQTDDENLVSVSATAAPDKVPAGGQTTLLLKLSLASGAHANSNLPADPNLIPTSFIPKPQASLTWKEPKYPKTSEVIEWYSTEPLSVFEDGAVIEVPLTINKTASAGQMMLEGVLRIQICDSEKCYPVRRVPVSASLSVIKENNVVAGIVPKMAANDLTVKTNSADMSQSTDTVNIEFAFTDFTGKARKFSEFKGKFVLLDFWATWCRPCLADIPKLKELYEKYKASGFEIIGMDSETIGDEAEAPDPEFAKETAARAKQIVTTRGVTWTQATNDTAVPVAMKIFNVKALPTKILIDREGKIIATIGEKDDLKAIVEKLLGGKK